MISSDLALFTFQKICESVKKLHSLEIVHRDLKPENMFLTHDLHRVTLIDFGSSEDLTQPQLRQDIEKIE